MPRLAAPYLPRRPHETALYRLVKEHGEDFLRHARETYDGPLARYVEDEIRGYLRCGDFSGGSAHTLAHVDRADVVAPNILRIRGGLLYAASSKIPWATLLRRTFDTDIESFARCGGHVRVRAVITEHETAARILDAIAQRRARDPTSPRAA